ncbi:MAG: hypothetical protein PHN97_02815 [Smithellaceae bacterium]|nr:hypothetical protein [Smithellaceae bacterium]
MILPLCSSALAGGMFGPLQTMSKKTGGVNTAVGCRYAEDTLKGDMDYGIRQHQVYSQAAYGASGRWEIYGRIGISDLQISDAFRSSSALTTVSRDSFEENWKFFGTLGAKAYYPVHSVFGVGAFVQGSCNFSNFTDEVSGTSGGIPFVTDIKVKYLWDVNFGIGLQATVPYGIQLYAGPFVYYTEADAYVPAAVPGIQSGAEKTSLKNASAVGGFFGAAVGLGRGFGLLIEGQYADRFSAGSAITYTY